jgi:hypothetical protein
MVAGIDSNDQPDQIVVRLIPRIMNEWALVIDLAGFYFLVRNLLICWFESLINRQ